MLEFINNFFAGIFVRAFSVLLKARAGEKVLEKILSLVVTSQQSVIHGGTSLLFAVPNTLNRYRVHTFSTKEPETLEWIDQIPQGAVVWDIGANVGLYSCYAAKARKCRVFSFEPSVFNLELLARNIHLNNLVDKITIVPLPLSSSLEISTLNMTSTEWGGALSTFGKKYGFDGKDLKKVFSFSTVGLTMDQAYSALSLPMPDYVKMDVDGIEHLILSGGEFILKQISGLAIEVNDDFIEHSQSIKEYCENAGLVFKEKRQSAMFKNNKKFGSAYNQFWYRP